MNISKYLVITIGSCLVTEPLRTILLHKPANPTFNIELIVLVAAYFIVRAIEEKK